MAHDLENAVVVDVLGAVDHNDVGGREGGGALGGDRGIGGRGDTGHEHASAYRVVRGGGRQVVDHTAASDGYGGGVPGVLHHVVGVNVEVLEVADHAGALHQQIPGQGHGGEGGGVRGIEGEQAGYVPEPGASQRGHQVVNALLGGHTSGVSVTDEHGISRGVNHCSGHRWGDVLHVEAHAVGAHVNGDHGAARGDVGCHGLDASGSAKAVSALRGRQVGQAFLLAAGVGGVDDGQGVIGHVHGCGCEVVEVHGGGWIAGHAVAVGDGGAAVGGVGQGSARGGVEGGLADDPLGGEGHGYRGRAVAAGDHVGGGRVEGYRAVCGVAHQHVALWEDHLGGQRGGVEQVVFEQGSAGGVGADDVGLQAGVAMLVDQGGAGVPDDDAGRGVLHGHQADLLPEVGLRGGDGLAGGVRGRRGRGQVQQHVGCAVAAGIHRALDPVLLRDAGGAIGDRLGDDVGRLLGWVVAVGEHCLADASGGVPCRHVDLIAGRVGTAAVVADLFGVAGRSEGLDRGATVEGDIDHLVQAGRVLAPEEANLAGLEGLVAVGAARRDAGSAEVRDLVS